ncbi:MAG: glutamate-5-semialdehyde dehydrogenase [Propionibacteriaceae bacterium]|jgi:glutamate-5-semialdehyde dehydrogenase|nr:glutamate-5-semialdehyde dehydrogenase [Propionibacteriaceae bacterium]
MTTPDFHDQALGARAAAISVATATRATKDAALHAMADALLANELSILVANQEDVERARAAGTSEAIIDRLSLDSSRLAAMAEGLRDLARLADPVGEVTRGWQLPNGVHIDQVRVPLGVVGIIYEARPNVTADAAGICLKSGNACLLRGSSSAVSSNRAIVQALKAGLDKVGVDARAVNLIEGGHEITDVMMAARGLVDVLIPRGGASLIEAVVRGSQVPVLETGTGNCHLYVDSSADQDMACSIMLNAKVQRPSVCNALETLVVNADIAGAFLPTAVDVLVKAGVTVHGDDRAKAIDSRIVDVVDEEWDSEFLSLDIRVAIVDNLDKAIDFIRAHSSGHSETIITNDAAHQKRFIAEVDAAAVLVNASSRFVDGGQFGFGAEIGISTQKLHARGPMALPEMTTTKYVITGDGQIR